MYHKHQRLNIGEGITQRSLNKTIWWEKKHSAGQ